MLLSVFRFNNWPVFRNISYIVSSIRTTAVILVTLYIGLFYSPQSALAKSVQTYVTVGNSAPVFSVNPSETVASYDTSPTNVGSTVTFTATGTDPNNDSYYLAICKTNAITTGTGGAAPTCNGGSWCISTVTAAGVQSSCSYTTLNSDPESGAWYGFICDNNASAKCSASSQGSGNAGSPFVVNHPPLFASIGNTTPVDVGASVTWTAGIGTSDSDTLDGADNVKLVVCKTSGVTNGDCDGGVSDRWCQSDAVANTPSCTYSIPTPTDDGTQNAYVYVFDSHNLAATGAAQNSPKNFVVNNALPVVSAVTLNAGSNINLNEGIGATTGVVLGASIVDNNGCTDIEAGSVTGYLYRSGVGFNNCDTVGEANNNSCYPVVTCTTSNCSAGVASADYTCTVYVKSYTDATDANTPLEAQNWLNTIKAVDHNLAVGSTEISAGVEVISLFGIDVTSSIDYGLLDVGQKNDPLNQITVTTATGNIGLNEELSGTDMSDGATHIIAVSNQKYALSVGTSYADGTPLSTSGTTASILIPKVTSDVGGSKPTYWGLLIPEGTIAGSYTGTNTVLAVKSPLVSW